MNISRAGVDYQAIAAPTDGSADMLLCPLDITLNRHGKGMIHDDPPGTCGRIEVEGGIPRQSKLNVARTRAHFPLSGLSSLRPHISASCFCAKSAINLAYLNISRPGADLNISSLIFQPDVTASGFC